MAALPPAEVREAVRSEYVAHGCTGLWRNASNASSQLHGTCRAARVVDAVRERLASKVDEGLRGMPRTTRAPCHHCEHFDDEAQEPRLHGLNPACWSALPDLNCSAQAASALAMSVEDVKKEGALLEGALLRGNGTKARADIIACADRLFESCRNRSLRAIVGQYPPPALVAPRECGRQSLEVFFVSVPWRRPGELFEQVLRVYLMLYVAVIVILVEFLLLKALWPFRAGSTKLFDARDGEVFRWLGYISYFYQGSFLEGTQAQVAFERTLAPALCLHIHFRTALGACFAAAGGHSSRGGLPHRAACVHGSLHAHDGRRDGDDRRRRRRELRRRRDRPRHGGVQHHGTPADCGRRRRPHRRVRAYRRWLGGPPQCAAYQLHVHG
jgi:hypothetical protein